MWNPAAEGWDAPLGLPLPAPGAQLTADPLIIGTDQGFHIDFDLPWFAVWMLSRAEEVASPERDVYDRFPARASLAWRSGYLDRPVVDEWIMVLRQVACTVWPGLKLSGPGAPIAVSHDVDTPYFLRGVPISGVIKRAVGDIVRRRLIIRGLEAPFRALLIRAGRRRADPYDHFAWMMEESERRGLRAAFHFLAGNTDPRFDRDYSLRDPDLQLLLSEIHERGHTIALHPSFGTYLRSDLIQAEEQELRDACARADISLPALSARMHYLRWCTPKTPRALSEAGVVADTTLGYAEAIGFRCGTCHPYDAFDPTTMTGLPLRIQPLIAMDITVLPGPYLNLKTPDALQRLVELKARCRTVGGTFTLCWHNSELDTTCKRQLFVSVLDA